MEKLTPIEKKFMAACKRAGLKFEVQEQVGRYRVDFLDKSRKLIIELDGHDSHKSKEDRTNDVKRERRLQRDGYTVIRFTGSEIFSDVDGCVEEIKQKLLSMGPQPVPAGAIYIDWQFVDRKSVTVLRNCRRKYPDKDLQIVSLSRLLGFIAGYLSLNGSFDAHLFGTASSFSTSLVALDALKIHRSGGAAFNITEHQNEFIADALVAHLHKFGTSYDRLILLADDNAYPPLLDRGRRIDALFRRDDGSTSMAAVDANRWQDIDHVIRWCMGIGPEEL